MLTVSLILISDLKSILRSLFPHELFWLLTFSFSLFYQTVVLVLLLFSTVAGM